MRRAGGNPLFFLFLSRGWHYASFESFHINDLRRKCTVPHTELCGTVQNCAELCVNETVNGALENQLIPDVLARRRPGRAALVLTSDG